MANRPGRRGHPRGAFSRASTCSTTCSATVRPNRAIGGRGSGSEFSIVPVASRWYGAGLIDLKRRQEGQRVNHTRVEHLYTDATLQVRRRRRKKIPVADRQPLVRPQAPNEGRSANFVFDRTTEERAKKGLGGLTPAHYARQPAAEGVQSPSDSKPTDVGPID